MTWYLADDYTPTGGPVAATAKPGSIGNGWVDQGGVWSITASNTLSQVANATNAFQNSTLNRVTDTPALDFQSIVRVNWATGQAFGQMCRVNNLGSTVNGYVVLWAAAASQFILYTIIGGAFTQIGTAAASGFTAVNGTQYDITTTVVQTNGTTTTATMSVATTAGTVLGSFSQADTTTNALQNATGGNGVYWNGTTTPGSIVRMQTFTDVAPSYSTSYTVALTPSANINAGSTGNLTIALVGGTTLTQPLAVTLSDGASGTFAPNPVIVQSNSSSVSCVYTPTATAGSRTVSYTHGTTGNAGMTGDSSLTATVVATRTWTIVSDYTPSGGPIAAGSVGNGFTDYGSSWSVSAGNVLLSPAVTTAAYDTALLARVGTADLTINSKQVIRFTAVANQQLYNASRVTRTGSITNAYLCGYDIVQGKAQVYTDVNGTLTLLPTGAAATITPGTQYDLTTTIVQTDATHTTISLTIATTTGTVLTSVSAVDTTAALQSVNGGTGVMYASVSGAAAGQINHIQTYTDSVANATSYSVAVSPASILSGSSASVSVALGGGSVLSSSLSVTLSDAASGTFSPNPVVINSGSTVGTSTYTPSGASGSRTVSYTYTGGNAGMTGNGSSVVTLISATLTTDTSVVLSPYNWRVGAAGTGSSQAWNPGSYARIYVTGSTSMIIYTDTNSTFGSYAYSVDNGVLSTLATIPSSGQISITLPDSSAHYVTLVLADSQRTGTGSYRWGGVAYLGIKAYSLGAGGTPNPSAAIAAKGSKNILIFGDSITDGQQAQDGTSNVVYDYSYFLGESLKQQGFEYGIVGASGVGFAVTGGGGVPPVYTPGNATQTSYDKVDSTNSRLVAGKFSPSPDIIYFNLGTNDALHAGSAATLSAWLTLLRVAAPSALILVGIPFAGYYRSNITTQFNSYQTATPDPNTQIIDLNIDSRITNLVYTQGDNVHPNAWGHANIASLLIAKLSLAYTKATTPKTGKITLFRR